ncbi:MAG: NUDIX hydrolase [Acidimicrobiales bacterium]|jgi:8-oxo-dGTP diphosphatase
MTEPVGAAPDERGVVRAGGGIVLRAGESGGWEVAVIHRPEHLDWTLPKGKLEAGEGPTECALREVKEETGYDCHLGRFVGEVEYLDRRDRVKIVSYWLMQPADGAFQPTAEVDELRWLPIAEALQLLSYSHDRDLLESVQVPLTTDGE